MQPAGCQHVSTVGGRTQGPAAGRLRFAKGEGPGPPLPWGADDSWAGSCDGDRRSACVASHVIQLQSSIWVGEPFAPRALLAGRAGGDVAAVALDAAGDDRVAVATGPGVVKGAVLGVGVGDLAAGGVGAAGVAVPGVEPIHLPLLDVVGMFLDGRIPSCPRTVECDSVCAHDAQLRGRRFAGPLVVGPDECVTAVKPRHTESSYAPSDPPNPRFGIRVSFWRTAATKPSARKHADFPAAGTCLCDDEDVEVAAGSLPTAKREPP